MILINLSVISLFSDCGSVRECFLLSGANVVDEGIDEREPDCCIACASYHITINLPFPAVSLLCTCENTSGLPPCKADFTALKLKTRMRNRHLRNFPFGQFEGEGEAWRASKDVLRYSSRRRLLTGIALTENWGAVENSRHFFYRESNWGRCLKRISHSFSSICVSESPFFCHVLSK